MIQSDLMTAGALVFFVSTTFIIGGSIASLGNFYPEILGALGASERVREILRMEGEIDLDKRKRQEWNILRQVCFRLVSGFASSFTEIECVC